MWIEMFGAAVVFAVGFAVAAYALRGEGIR